MEITTFIKIPLTNSKLFTLVDKTDLHIANKYVWRVESLGYAVAWDNSVKPRKIVKLHQLILPTKLFVDHKNRNILDNQRDNLRTANRSQNKVNCKKYKNNSSGNRGISYHKRLNKWQAYINWKGKRIYLGYFLDIKDAINARNKAALKYHGEFACLNP